MAHESLLPVRDRVQAFVRTRPHLELSNHAAIAAELNAEPGSPSRRPVSKGELVQWACKIGLLSRVETICNDSQYNPVVRSYCLAFRFFLQSGDQFIDVVAWQHGLQSLAASAGDAPPLIEFDDLRNLIKMTEQPRSLGEELFGRPATHLDVADALGLLDNAAVLE